MLDGSPGLTAAPIDVAVTAPVGLTVDVPDASVSGLRLTGDLDLTKAAALLAWGGFSR